MTKALPRPNWAVERKSNGPAHVTYTLATPVLRTARARLKPLAHISEFYRDRLGADPRYNGVLTHNPLARAPRKGTMQTHWLARRPYTLTHLKSFIPSGWQAPTVPATEIGRNVGLFKAGCQWAGSPVNQWVAEGLAADAAD